jgi:hypothetical protein
LEWDPLDTDGFAEMQTSIREDFGGIEKWCHRDDLIKHLDRVLGEFDHVLARFIFGSVVELMGDQYGLLKNVLLEVDKRATETLTRTPLPRFHPFQFVC